MPIYAYRCEGCGFQKDALQKLSDPPLVDCPECGQSKLVKQVTAAGFALKGTGWYVTDFRDSKKSAAKTPDTKSAESSVTANPAVPDSAAASSDSASASATSAASAPASPSAASAE